MITVCSLQRNLWARLLRNATQGRDCASYEKGGKEDNLIMYCMNETNWILRLWIRTGICHQGNLHSVSRESKRILPSAQPIDEKMPQTKREKKKTDGRTSQFLNSII